MNGPDLAIDVRGLTKRFGKSTVVDHVDIQMPRGQVWGFLGPNGSGKTTTIRMLCGLLKPDAGQGTCLSFDILKNSREIKNQVGNLVIEVSEKVLRKELSNKASQEEYIKLLANEVKLN